MKRVFTLLLTVLLLFTVTALAVPPAYTPEIAAQKVAVAAIKVKYGLTTDMLGLFAPVVTITENETRVQFHPNGYLPVDRIGVYEVIITDSAIDVHWTHDDQDPYAWQSDSIFEEYWGAWQLQACLDVRGIWNLFVDENQQATEPLSPLDSLEFTLAEGKEGTMSINEAYGLADAAVRDIYGLTVYEVDAMEHDYDADILVLADGTKLWRLFLGSPDRAFTVFLNDTTGEVFHITFSTGGNG